MFAKMRGFPLIIALVLAIAISADSQNNSLNNPPNIHNIKGVWGEKIPVKLELVKTIGGLNEVDPNLAFGAPYDVVRDASGYVYVLDTLNSRIQKISPEGRFVLSIGRQGQGPGEFQRIFSFDIDDDNQLCVLDVLGMRIHFFSLDGSFRRSIKLSERVNVQIRRLKSRSFVKGSSFFLGKLMDKREKLPKLLEILDSDGRLKAAFGEATDFKAAVANSVANIFQLETDEHDNIYVSFCYQNRIEKYSPDGKLLWRADRPLAYSTKIIDKGSYEADSRGNVGIKGPRMNTVSRGIGIDSEDRIWVNTWNRQMTSEEIGAPASVRGAIRRTVEPIILKMDIHRIDVFNKDGVLLGMIPMDCAVHGLRIFGDNLFVWERNDAIVYQFKIVDRKTEEPAFR